MLCLALCISINEVFRSSYIAIQKYNGLFRLLLCFLRKILMEQGKFHISKPHISK
jgi:hypothetical protein